jgi:hypothetical protein
MNDGALNLLVCVHLGRVNEVHKHLVLQSIAFLEKLIVKIFEGFVRNLYKTFDFEDYSSIGILVNELFIEGEQFKDDLVESISYS